MFFIFFGSEKKLGVGMVGKKNKGRTGVREREREESCLGWRRKAASECRSLKKKKEASGEGGREGKTEGIAHLRKRG